MNGRMNGQGNCNIHFVAPTPRSGSIISVIEGVKFRLWSTDDMDKFCMYLKDKRCMYRSII